MKKLFALVLVAGMVAFVACGPSQKEKDAKEKAKQDSIAAVEKVKKEADSLAAVEKEKAKQDSIAKAEKKKAPKHTGNKPPEKTKEQQVKEKIKTGRG